MSTLIILRHAKSDWSIHGQKDFDRGRNDAPKMGEYLKSNGIIPDLILSTNSNFFISFVPNLT